MRPFVIVLLMGLFGGLPAQDLYYALTLDHLHITSGTLPTEIQSEGEVIPGYARVTGGEAYIYLDWSQAAVSSYSPGDPAQTTLVLRMTVALPADGMLALPVDGAQNHWTRVGFHLSADTPPADAKKFLDARASYGRAIANLNDPGAAWFRHLGDVSPELHPTPRSGQDADFEDAFDLMGGGRAISENLQLDRTLNVGDDSKPAVALRTLPGISVAPLDFTTLAKEVHPTLDDLASRIPADQHAVFFPNFLGLVDTLDHAEALGAGPAAMVSTCDAQTRDRYQKQLCLQLNEFSRIFGPQVISSVAITGSDPYLRVGSDVAILFNTTQPELVRKWLAAHQTVSVESGAKAVSGSIGGIGYLATISDDRSICSYLATIQGVVVVTNSLAQLQRLLAVGQPTDAALSATAEYRFFRDRYRAQSDELALVVLSDSCIRRWSSARWRIADSRRTRAAAVLAELQARRIDGQAEGNIAKLQSMLGVDLGAVTYSGSTVRSASYGTLSFMTPIIEIPLDQVTAREAAAYEHFRDSYQLSWRAWFDPIAVRLYRTASGIGVDMSVLPLIAHSEYQELLDIVGNVSIAPGQGDRHPESLLHVIMAIDHASREFQDGNHGLAGMSSALGIDPLSWMGTSIAAYADQDPIWQGLNWKGTGDMTVERSLPHLPIALNIAVSNPLKLAVFLTGMHALVDSSAPGLVTWSTATYKGQGYVKITSTDEASQMLHQQEPVTVFYVATADQLVLTLREDVLQHAIDRQLSRRTAIKQPASTARADVPWLGNHVALSCSPGAPRLIAGMLSQEISHRNQRNAWSMLPILNEWHQRFPGQDPVAVHERLWGVRLRDPAGGTFVWNDQWQTMESTVYGNPCEPKAGPAMTPALAAWAGCDAGLTFQSLSPSGASSMPVGAAPDSAQPPGIREYGLRASMELSLPATRSTP